jgi:hypothetical protein
MYEIIESALKFYLPGMQMAIFIVFLVYVGKFFVNVYEESKNKSRLG